MLSLSAAQPRAPLATQRGPAARQPVIGALAQHAAAPQQRRHRRRRPAAAAAADGSTAAPTPASAAAGSSTAVNGDAAAQQPQPWITAAVLRKVTAAADANEALDILCAELGGSGGGSSAAAGDSRGGKRKGRGGSPGPASGPPRLAQLSEGHCLELLMACLERGNTPLALSIFRAMSAAAAGAAAPPAATSLLSLSSLDGGDAGGAAQLLRWPLASVQTAAALVVGLARCLQTRDAITLVNSVRARGLASTEDVNFGHVVACPQDRCGCWGGVQPGSSCLVGISE